MLEVMVTCGRWSKIVAEDFLKQNPGLRILQKTLTISVLGLLLTLVGCTICGKNVREETESWNSLVAAWQSWFSKSTLKSPSRKTDWFSISFLGLYQGWFSCIVVYLLQMTQVIFIAIVYIIDWKFIFYNSSFGYSSNTEVNWCWIKEIFKAFYAFGKETCINMKDGKIFFAM